MKQKDIKAFVFDVDGTLLYTIPDIIDSINRVLKRNGFPLRRYEEGRHFVGNGSLTLVRRALSGTDVDEETVKKILREYNYEYSLHACDKTMVYPGLKETLDVLKQHVMLFALSNKPNKDAHDVLERYFGKGFFTDIQGEIPGVPLKPDPTGLNQLLARNNVKKEEALFIGDSDVDYRTAVNGKLQACCVLWGYRTKEELLREGADCFASEPKDLLRYIDD